MKLTVLVDNNTYIDQYYLGEPAVSYYIEDEGARVLLDTGYSDIFLSNAEKMGIDLSRLTHIALSHGHNDHTGGLRFLLEPIPTASPPSGTALLTSVRPSPLRKRPGTCVIIPAAPPTR